MRGVKAIYVILLVALCGSVRDASAADANSVGNGPAGAPAVSEAEKIDKGLQVEARIGGWEPDYTKYAYEGVLSYKGFDSLHLYAGYGYADQIYYAWDKVYAKAYYFYQPYSYAKIAVSLRHYTYPTDSTVQRPNPDSSSYDRVPTIEGEVSHWFSRTLRGTVGFEYFRPNFFYDTTASADNYKISTEVYYRTPLDFLSLKVMYAILRDPDPAKTEIKGRDNVHTPAGVATQTSVIYRTSSLLGGGLELAAGRWEAGVLYLPNRDLDQSYRYSILTNVRYHVTEKLTGGLDYVYDVYSPDSNFSGETARVYMASATYDVSPRFRVGTGLKYIDLPDRNDTTGFVTLRLKTGVLF